MEVREPIQAALVAQFRLADGHGITLPFVIHTDEPSSAVGSAARGQDKYAPFGSHGCGMTLLATL